MKQLVILLYFFLTPIVFELNATNDEIDLSNQLSHIPCQINFNDPSVVEKLFNTNCSQFVESLIEEKYEKKSRPIKNSTGFDYGNSFPTYPELLSFMMSNIEGKTVLEMGASNGTESLFLACARAKPCQIYVNDLDKEELSDFESRKAKLPSDEIRSILTSIEGDALEIRSLRPDLKEKIDILYVRNLFHFFNAEQREKFFDVCRWLLKPGGQIALVVNYPNFTIIDAPEGYNKDEEDNILYDVLNITIFVNSLDNMIIGQSCHEYGLRSFEGQNLSSDCNDKKIRAFAQNLIDEQMNNNPLMKMFKKSDLSLNIAKVKNYAYSPIALQNIFNRPLEGFKVSETFKLNDKGHVSNDYKDLIIQCGVIVQYNTESLT